MKCRKSITATSSMEHSTTTLPATGDKDIFSLSKYLDLFAYFNNKKIKYNF
jgi:hypothetical protein